MNFKIDNIKKALKILQDHKNSASFTIPINILTKLLHFQEENVVEKWKKVYQHDKTKVLGFDTNGLIASSLTWQDYMKTQVSNKSFIGKILICFQTYENSEGMKALIKPHVDKFDETIIVEDLKENKDFNRYIDLLISVIRYSNVKHVTLYNCSHSFFKLVKEIMKEYDKRFSLMWMNYAKKKN